MAPSRILDGTTGKPYGFDRNPESGWEKPFDDFNIPQVIQFQAILQSGWRSYLQGRGDESLKHDRNDALVMRRDAFHMGLMQERYLAVASLKWHLEVDDEKDPVQTMVRDTLTKQCRRIPDLKKFHWSALEAIWYGKSANQVLWDWDAIDGRRALILRKWAPTHGDSIGWMLDGTPYILVSPAYANTLPKAETIYTTMGGVGLVLRGSWREKFILHQHLLEAADWFDFEKAENVHGIGVRDKLFWLDWMKRDYLEWLVTFLERVGLGLTVWLYDASNSTAKAETEKAMKENSRRANIAVPSWPDKMGRHTGGIERIETPLNGTEVLLTMMEHIEDIMERYVLGQSASSSSKTSGMGTHDTSFQQDTKYQITKFDADNLAETYTGSNEKPGLISLMKRYTFPELGRSVPDFPVRWVFNVPDPEAAGKLEAASKVISLGVPCKVDEVRALTGLSDPKEGDEVVGGAPQPQLGPDGLPIEEPGQPGQAGAKPGGPPKPGQPKEDKPAKYAMGQFEESKHPRGQPENTGQFGPGAGGGTPKASGQSPATGPYTQGSAAEPGQPTANPQAAAQLDFASKLHAERNPLGTKPPPPEIEKLAAAVNPEAAAAARQGKADEWQARQDARQKGRDSLEGIPQGVVPEIKAAADAQAAADPASEESLSASQGLIDAYAGHWNGVLESLKSAGASPQETGPIEKALERGKAQASKKLEAYAGHFEKVNALTAELDSLRDQEPEGPEDPRSDDEGVMAGYDKAIAAHDKEYAKWEKSVEKAEAKVDKETEKLSDLRDKLTEAIESHLDEKLTDAAQDAMDAVGERLDMADQSDPEPEEDDEGNDITGHVKVQKMLFGRRGQPYRYDRQTPKGQEGGEGHWVTIGAQMGEDGKKHGGSPVFIKGGKIEKGHPGLKGKRVEDFAPDKPARQQNKEAKAMARAEWGGKASQAGLEAEHLHGLAGEMLEHDKRFKAEHLVMLQEARRALKEHGGWSGEQTKKAQGGFLTQGSVKGMDEVAETLAAQYPHHFPPHMHSSDRLFDLLAVGNPTPMSDEEAYTQAFDHLMEAKMRPQPEGDDSVVFDDEGDPIPFAKRGSVQRHGLFDEVKHPRGQPDNAGKFGSGGGAAKPAAHIHHEAMQAIPHGQEQHVHGWPVRRTGEASWRIETSKGHVEGDPAAVLGRIEREWSDQAPDRKRTEAALARAESYTEPNWMQADQIDAATRAFAALPKGTRVVSLDEKTRGRLGTIQKGEGGRNVVLLDGSPVPASGNVEPLDPALSWRVEQAAPGEREPEQRSLFRKRA